MPDGYKPEVGHRVRVVLEGAVFSASDFFFEIGSEQFLSVLHPESKHVVSVERLPDPEPEWQPGDVVLDAGGSILGRVQDDKFPWRRLFDSDRFSDAYPERPLTPLVRDGKPWAEAVNADA